MTSRKQREEDMRHELEHLNFRLQHIEHVIDLLIRVNKKAVPKRSYRKRRAAK